MLTRREALRRTAVTGAALVYAVPTLQVLSMTGAGAATSSDPGNGGPGGAPDPTYFPPGGVPRIVCNARPDLKPILGEDCDPL